MNKHTKTAKQSVCSLAAVLSSGALMVSNVSAATITYYSGSTADDGGNGVKTLEKSKDGGWGNDSTYRGLYATGSGWGMVPGVLDEANTSEEYLAGVGTFEKIIEDGYKFENWKVSYQDWQKNWQNVGIRTGGAQFNNDGYYSFGWNNGYYDLVAVAQWTDLKKPVFANGATERMVVGTPFEVMDGEVKIGEISLSYEVNTTRDAEDATETTPLAVTSIDEEIAFTVDDEHGYELKKVDVQIGEAEAEDVLTDVKDGVLFLKDVTADVNLDVEMGLKEFEVIANVDDETHAHVEPIVEGKTVYGDTATFNVIVEAGYEIAGILNGDEPTDYQVIDNKLAIENVTNDMDLTIVIMPEEYTVMDGEDQIFEAEKEEDLVVKFSGDNRLFRELIIDDEVIDTKNYTITPGSTIVAVNHDFITENYAEGTTHTIIGVFANGNYAETTFEIAAPKTPDTGANNKLSASTIVSVLTYAATGSFLALAILALKRKMNR